MKELYERIKKRLANSLEWQRGMLQHQATGRDPKAFTTAAYIDMLNELDGVLDQEYNTLRKE